MAKLRSTFNARSSENTWFAAARSTSASRRRISFRLATYPSQSLNSASTESVLTNLESLPDDKQTAVRNNAGGHANHSLFWKIMSPDGGGEPGGALRSAIEEAFGSFDELRTAINDGGVKRFGSGWSWLVWDGTGLSVYSTPNQDSPIMQSHVPLLGIDVWEHAYYLSYQNKRPAYLEAWWNVVNWTEVARRFVEGQS